MKKKNEVSTHCQGVSIRIKKRDRKYHYKIGKFEESGRMWCRFHPKILIREFEDLICWEVSSDYFDFTFVFEKESDDTIYFDEQHSSNTEEQANIIKGLLKEGAYDIAKDFIDYILYQRIVEYEPRQPLSKQV